MAMVEHGASVARNSVTRRRSAILAGLMAALVLLTIIAWSQRAQTVRPSASGGLRAPAVTGVVRVEGGPPTVAGNGSDFYPLRHATLVVNGATAAGATLVRRFRADAQGHFGVSLPAGRYTVTALAYGPETRPLSTQPHARVTVTTGHPVSIRLTGHVI